MRTFAVLLSLSSAACATAAVPVPNVKNFYELETKTLEGAAAPLSTYAGKVSLVVNTASKCGKTPQYEGLEALYQELKDQGFTILGFPSNDFMGQEPGTAKEIREFCTLKYKVTFPMFEKVRVKGGEKSPLYAYLSAKHPEPSWNFAKYLIGKDGQVVAAFSPGTLPDSAELRKAITEALAAK